LDLIYPTGNINVTQNEFFNVTVNTSCSGGDCGEVNISLAYFEDNFYSDNTEDEASGTCIDNASAYDENWATYASTSGGCNIYINYTVPSGVINAIVESKHYAEDNGDITNFSCWNYSGEGWEQIFYDDSGPGDSFFLNNTIYPDCMSGSKLMFNVYIEDGFDATFLYEEQVWWNVTSPLFVLVPASGTPFYTNVTNPNTTTLNAEENLLKTFWVNASGVAGTNKSFFVFANTTSDMSVSNITSQFNVTITVLDTTFPLIDYGVITEITNSLANRSWIYVNVSVTEDNEDTITFNLYNNSILVNSTALTDSTRFVNWTGLGVGNYSYNVTVNDSAGNTNYTGTRTIDLMNIAQGCRNIVWKGAYTLVNSTIVNYPSTCMVIDTSDVYFDGQGYTIDGVNTGNGIHVVGSSGNELTNVTINNTFVNDFATGLYFEYTDNSFVFDSNFSSGNSRNIRILYSNNNIFNNLNITDASGSNDQGLELAAADFNNISNSYFNNNNRAIIISTASNNNIILNNTIINSVTIGIKAEAISADNNLIYNNFFNNTNNYNTVAGADNYFNTTLTEETNIIGGANIGGNYWGGIAGNNYSDTCTVTVTDNICDNPMNITDGTECVGCSGKDIDELPLSYNVAGCTYNSECNGDEYCLNSACANLSAGAKFLLKDALGSTVATIDSSGNVGLTGSFNDSNSAVCSASGNNALNINDNAIVRSWINESGGMCIGGALYENAGADLSCANSFIIKDSSGNNKVCISKTSGNLTLSGYLGKNA